MTLEDYLERNAQLYPEKTAVVCGDERCTYRELHERVEARMAEYKDLRRGQIVCLRAPSNIGYLVDYFALHRRGCVAVPLEQSMPEDSFRAISAELCRHTVPEGSADILYTTGTTGRSKGAIVSHRTIIADAENLIDGQGFSHEQAFVVSGPLNHIGSLSKIWPVVLVGATLIIVDGLKDIDRFYRAFDYPSPRMATFLVPASIRILLQFSPDRMAALADKMEFMETGAAAISQSDMEMLCRLLPRTRLYNTYASTETGIISTYNFNDGHPQAGCLGRPMKHSRLFITEEGTIACQGPTLMTGYVGDPELTATVLRDSDIGNHQHPTSNTQQPTLFTSDCGIIDEEGRLHLSGRADDVINVGGFKVAPAEVEDAAMSMPGIADCICISAAHPIVGRALKLLVVMAPGEEFDKRVIARYLKTRLEPYKIPLLYEQVEKVCRTYNGKLNRKAYR